MASARLFASRCSSLLAATESSTAVAASGVDARTAETVKQICSYIKTNYVQNPNNKKEIQCDEKLKSIFDGKEKVEFLQSASLVSNHFPKAELEPELKSKTKTISPAFQEFLGASEVSRTDALKQVWAYIKSENLQNPENKREIRCDEKLKSIFDGNEKVQFLQIPSLISKHFPKPEPKPKTKTKTISPAFQQFLGASKVSRTDAVKQVWAYIKSENLQNPENKREIRCDEQLKTIFDGKEKVGFTEIASLISKHFQVAE